MENVEWLKLAEACLDVDEDDSFIDSDNTSKFIFSEIASKYNKEVKSVASCWEKMGLPMKKREERVNDIIMVLGDLFVNIEKTELESLDSLIKIKEKKIDEIKKLTEDLGEVNYEVVYDLPLLLMARKLHFKCEDLKNQRDKLLKEWNEYKEKKSTLSSRLGIVNKKFQTTSKIPNTADITKLKSYVDELETSLQKKEEKLLLMRKILTKLFNNLEKTMESEVEMQILEGNVEDFVLSDKNLKRIDKLHDELEAQLQINNERKISLTEKLNKLYERLEISDEERNQFTQNVVDSKPSTLRKMEDEIKRYELLKKQNMSKFICKLRPEIVTLWDKCFVGSKYRKYFNGYLNDSDFNNELLEIHEKEVDRLKAFYEENYKLISKLDAHKEDWQRFRDLDQKMRDPSRFNNRGGTLLKEEAARKKLQKSIPKLENEITDLSNDWFKSHGTVFNVFDESIDSYFRKLWDEFTNEKENEKKNRQQVKKNEIEAALKGRRTPTVTLSNKKKSVKRNANVLKTNGENSKSKIRKLNTLSPSKKSNVNIEKEKKPARTKLDFKNVEKQQNKVKLVRPVIVPIEKVLKLPSSSDLICEVDFQKTLQQRTNSFMNSTEY